MDSLLTKYIENTNEADFTIETGLILGSWTRWTSSASAYFTVWSPSKSGCFRIIIAGAIVPGYHDFNGYSYSSLLSNGIIVEVGSSRSFAMGNVTCFVNVDQIQLYQPNTSSRFDYGLSWVAFFR